MQHKSAYRLPALELRARENSSGYCVQQVIQKSQLHRLQDWQVNTFLKSAYTELVGQAQFTVFRQCGDAGWQMGPPWSRLQPKGCVRGLALPSAGCRSSWVPLGVRVFQDFTMLIPMVITTSLHGWDQWWSCLLVPLGMTPLFRILFFWFFFIYSMHAVLTLCFL